MDVGSFDEIAGEFNARVARIVWCTVSTVDAKGRPRSRILHPIWEGSTGWILTGRNSHKAKHIARNPHVSLSYWDQQHQQIYADCLAEWVDDDAEKVRIWDLYKTTPPPLGYDPAIIPPWKDGPLSPEVGLLKLTPWRIELSSLMEQPPKVWRNR
jgi:uncharacterized pyridoxamine 5'-phosphate oxidase family protein